MNVDNFVVRPQRQLVESYARPEAWAAPTPDAYSELASRVAGLPTALEAEPEEAKRFDLLILRLQLALLRKEASFTRLRDQVKAIAGVLEGMERIPMVRDQITLIQDLQEDAWWQDLTVPMLESVRRRLRALVPLIEKTQRKPIFTNFEDELGTAQEIELPGFTPADGFERFRQKTRMFLKAHLDDVAIHKLRMNKALTALDLAHLEQILVESSMGAPEELQRAVEEARGLGLFVRSLVGLDREAAKEGLAAFLADKTLGANQIIFVNMIVDYLTEHGVMAPDLLYESPFTDVSPAGPDQLFTGTQVDELLAVLDQVRSTAVAL
jgi:type I restriction enzyme R subunit